ncbi:hypothetical protein CIW61_00985 [Enterobacter cloacae]|nr:hypothetical protein CIW61_00985 [Enterobacter cloacae]
MSNIDKQAYRADGGDIGTDRLREIADNPYGDEEKCWLAKRVLASLDVEPVAWTDADELRDVKNGGNGYLFAIGGEANKFADPRRQVMLYTIPPAPVSVPDAVDYSDLDPTSKDREIIEAIAECKGWNACRAAMLQGAEPSKMSEIMPDYEGGDMTQRELFQAGWEAHHAAMLRAGAPVQFGWSQGHFGYHTLFNAISKAVNIQGGAISISVSAFEDAMLAAAPKPEA